MALHPDRTPSPNFSLLPRHWPPNPEISQARFGTGGKENSQNRLLQDCDRCNFYLTPVTSSPSLFPHKLVNSFLTTRGIKVIQQPQDKRYFSCILGMPRIVKNFYSEQEASNLNATNSISTPGFNKLFFYDLAFTILQLVQEKHL